MRDQFPEAARDELASVVFFGKISHLGMVMVARKNDGSPVHRILNEDLAKLQSSTEQIHRDIKASGMTVDGEIEVYEKGSDRVLMRGTTIDNKFKEAIRRNALTAGLLILTATASVVAVLLSGPWGCPMPPQGEPNSDACDCIRQRCDSGQAWWTLSRRPTIDWKAVGTT